MASQFNAAGNEDIRTYIQNNWTHIAVVDDGGSEQLRVDVAASGLASWSSGPSTNPLEATLTITGQDIIDAGGSLPVTLTETEQYKSSSATTVMAEDTYTDATLEASSDEVTVTHSVEVPQI